MNERGMIEGVDQWDGVASWYVCIVYVTIKRRGKEKICTIHIQIYQENNRTVKYTLDLEIYLVQAQRM